VASSSSMTSTERGSGESIDTMKPLHEALDWADGVIANPGAWTHYSYAIRDALELFSVPVVEVHLSDLEAREEWRRRSVIADVTARRILGKGAEGYREALEFLTEQP
jgi:3-dehydroquinate dehydratase-2